MKIVTGQGVRKGKRVRQVLSYIVAGAGLNYVREDCVPNWIELYLVHKNAE